MLNTIQILQAAVALTILTVWTVRFNRATPYRGKNAKNMVAEFKAYGLSENVMYLVGFCKVTLAVLLLVGIFVSGISMYASAGLAAFMAVAVIMHIKVKDPIKKGLPAATLLILSTYVAYSYYLMM